MCKEPVDHLVIAVTCQIIPDENHPQRWIAVTQSPAEPGLPLLALGCHLHLLKRSGLMTFLVSGLFLACKNTEQLLLQPRVQDGIGDRSDSFGPNLSGGRTKQGHQFGSSIAQIFMRLQLGMTLEMPARSWLGSGGIRTGFILIPQGDATGLCQLIDSFNQTFFFPSGQRLRRSDSRPTLLKSR